MPRRLDIEHALKALAPRVPRFERDVIVDRALDSRGLGQARPGEAAWLALVSYVRHACTDYDALLEEGYDAESARFFVQDTMVAVLTEWGVRRPLVGEADLPTQGAD
jgi:hypothetical protein